MLSGKRTPNSTLDTRQDDMSSGVWLIRTFWDKPFTTDKRINIEWQGEESFYLANAEISGLLKDLIDISFRKA